MTDIFSISEGVQVEPIYGIIYGPAGLGKTSFIGGRVDENGNKIEGAKDAILIGPENKSEALCKKMSNPKNFTEFIAQIDYLYRNIRQMGIKTIGVDSLDHIEIILHNEIAQNSRAKSIDQVGNYGAGYKNAFARLVELEDKLHKFVTHLGINVIYTAHASMRSVSDPHVGAQYDSYELALHKSGTGKTDYSKIFVEKVSTVLFANVEKYLNDAGYAQSTMKRVLYTQSTPGFVAKNRYNLPFQMNLDYSEFIGHVKKFYGLV